MLVNHQEIEKLIKQNALFVINHSAGKDSQTMTILLRKYIPKSQLVVIHAELPGMDWEGNEKHILETIGDLEYHSVKAKKTFFEMVEKRKMFPSPKYRQCTSDLKRGPINKKIREIANERGYKIIVNCTGLRAQESNARAEKPIFEKNKRESNSKREWFEYLPIHHYLLEDVWKTIEDAGEKPHYAYSLGMSRLSCMVCIMSNERDLKISAKHNPQIIETIGMYEDKYDFTFIMPTKKHGKRTLKEIVYEK